MKLLFFLASVALSMPLAQAQTPRKWCATPTPSQSTAKQTHRNLLVTDGMLHNLATNKITIPVVVHIIHSGETEGVGSNISATQIKSQIDLLNIEFNFKHKDTLKANHPFYKYTANFHMNFVLASTDPNGLPTNGITRHNEGKAGGYNMNDFENEIKANTYWPPSKYLNIWVSKVDSTGGYAGYAQLPISYDTTVYNKDSTTDGVVMNDKYMGTIGDSLTDNTGRVLIHEIGHWLNLYHSFESYFDNMNGTQCEIGDKVDDTPFTDPTFFACPAFPYDANNSCGSDANGVMFMNYMDYTDFTCENMFTKGQYKRAIEALVNYRPTYLPADFKAAAINRTLTYIDASIFPNPSAGFFTFYSKTKGMYYIINPIGQIVQNIDLRQTDKTTISGLSAGVYYIQSNVGIINQKIVVQ